MTWRIAVRHRTGYAYVSEVLASYNEARMTPASGAGQRTLEARLEISPVTRPLRYRDYWGTLVGAFDVHVPHRELVVTATSVVETAQGSSTDARVGWPAIRSSQTRDVLSEFLAPSRYVDADPSLTEAAGVISAEHEPAAAGRAAAEWAHAQLQYAAGVTDVHTTSAQAHAVGKGVCQDFAHLTLALLRRMQLPARYVSGYLFPLREAGVGDTTRGESHAWVEFWAGDWVPVDPTNLADVEERHIAVARGRDYADVRPLSGVYNGPPAESLGVSVELTRLR